VTTLHARHRLRTAILGVVECQVYEDEGTVAVALLYGRLMPGEQVLVRLQSACLYGESLLATDCDCRAQLDDALLEIRRVGTGVIIHLSQEGRGAGLLTKARGYELQDRENLDTVEAYHRLNVDLDSRDYRLAADILHALQVDRVRLITNNPRKIHALEKHGFQVSREINPPAATDTNIDYLRVKAAKLGHLLDLPSVPDADNADRRPRIVSVGAAVIDHVFRVDHNPQLGRARQATEYFRQPGGKAFNQAIAAARLGGDATLLAPRGVDTDAIDISKTLVRERVEAWLVDTPQPLSPQTAVVEPTNGQPTYLGWLTREHMVIPAQSISRWSLELRNSDAVTFTLETSPDTINAVLRMVPTPTLGVLTASPVLEGTRIATELLERIDVVIGSESELRGLLGAAHPGNAEDVGRRLAELCGLTVVITDLKGSVRTVMGVNPYLPGAVVVESPAVRSSEKLNAAVGNADVLSAAFTLEVLRLARDQRSGDEPALWQSDQSFFARPSNLLDVLVEAVVAEAWVVKSGAGGFDTFPRKSDLASWVHQAPKVLRIAGSAEPREA
jgi:3,4-dihydroxy 2-butanone 4-phosphate synthase/GTP cyclohydrolase II